VVDLAQGHLAALTYLTEHQQSITVNLGTGLGVSVKQLADIFSEVTGVPVPYHYANRRTGDVAACYANTFLAETKLNWKAKLGVERMCSDAWRWQLQNPEGY
jgi:UDP-glucose 4-epimerase